MKNIFVTPTDKYSPLVHSTSKYGGLFLSRYYSPMKEMGDSYQNIYITSDEEIKEGDWVYSETRNKVCKVTGVSKWSHKDDYSIDLDNENYYIHNSYGKKIILTTDQDLIKDGVQAIDDEFLEWFVKNPSCESVAVKQELGVCLNCEWNYDSCPNTEECLKDNYKIIIPQEEPNKTHHLDELPNMDKDVVLKMYNAAIPKLESKQETLEEAAEKYARKQCDDMYYNKGLTELSWGWETSFDFINGAKWQAKRMYSEEEVIDLLQEMNDWPTIFDSRIDIKEWFKQFKKK